MLLCLAMLIGTLPIYVTADEVTDSQNDELQTYAGAADPDPNGEGTVENPYLITSVSELMWFRDKVNSGNNSISARLMCDIAFDNDVNDQTPIGNADHPYNGTFDGNNYRIGSFSKEWYLHSEASGLFGYIGQDGVIKKLNFYFRAVALDNTAMLAHENKGTIEECSVDITWEEDSTIDDNTFCNFAYINSGTIKNCLSILRINSFPTICGFANSNSGTIENSLCVIAKNKHKSPVYAITKDTAAGAATNCYCILGIGRDTEYVQDAATVNPKSIFGLLNSEQAAYMKELAWKLNNNGSDEGSSTDPWRYGVDSDGDALDYPTLNPTDQKVTKSDGSETVIPHTHRVDGIIREFTCGDIYRGGEYIYFDSDNSLVNELIVEENMTVCLNGHNLNINLDSIVVPSGINFTVTDCQETAGTVTSGGNAGVTVDGGTFVLDNASVSGCSTGIDYQSGTVKLSGKAKVTDNTQQNIKLAKDKKLTFGILDESAHFGVTYDGNIAVGGEVEITDKTGAKYASQLSSDNEEYVIANGSNAVVLKNPEAHSHCVCGAEHKEISGTDENKTTTGHTAEESVVFKPWNPNSHRDSNNLPTLPETAGSYYLTEDADLKTGAWEPNGNVTLCLNGHTVTFDNIKDSSGHDIGTVWLDGEDDNLTVTDCGPNGTITMSGEKQNCVRITKGGVFNLYGGTMKGFSRAVSIGDYSSLDLYRGYGTFNMYGGTLTENTYALGAAVYGNHKDAKVVMYGGKIINNKSALIGADTTQGGGVCVTGGGSFTMYNGEISGNGQADTTVLASKQAGTMFGGGVYVSGTFKMYGGKIADNVLDVDISGKTLAAYGGGVCARDTFEMYGGEISGNTVKKGYGGGVYINNSGSSPCIKNATILRNKVEEQQGKLGEGGGGGGIYYYSYHHSTEAAIPLTLENTTVADNSLHANVGDSNRYGGGAGVFGTTDIIIDRCVISGNELTGKNGQTDSETSEPIGAIGGAGVCVPSANLTIKNSKIVGNKAITDDGAADNRKLVSGGVLFCDSRNKFTVSGNVNISGNTVDGADGNVYLEKMTRGSAEQTKQNQITVDTLAGTSKIGVTAKTAPTGSTTVTVATSENEIPDDIFTSDKSDYKAVLADDKKSVSLTYNTDVAEVIHSDGTKTGYEKIYDAIQAAQNGETVKVIKDNWYMDNDDHDICLKKDIILDLNEKDVTVYGLIDISGNVTIKNGTISIDVLYSSQSYGRALITFEPQFYKTLTLDDVTVTKEDEDTLALYVNLGKLIVKGGTINGGVRFGTYNPDAELSDVTIKKTKVFSGYGENNDGVIFDSADRSKGGIARFLKSGYAYKKEDDTFIDLSANPTLIPIGTTVTVAPCTHGFESGKCKYCGYVCKHEHIINNKCSDCGAVLPVLVRDLYNEKIIYGRYSTLEEAFASINKGEARTVVYYGADDHTFENDIEIKGTVYYYSTGGKSLKFNNEKSFVVKDGGALYGTAYGYISAVTLEAGSVYSSESDFVVGTLTVYDDSKILINNKLQNGNFEKIVILNGDKKVGDILHTTVHRTFRHKGADGSWATGAWVTDEELGRTTIENVSIVKKPFCNESITVSPEGELTYKKALNVTMSANKTDLDGDYGDTTYEWFATHSPNVVLSTNSSYTTTLSVAGTYEFGCRITRGGYTRTVTKQITVEPKDITNAVVTLGESHKYNGSEQTQGITSVTVDGLTLSESDYDISDNKAADVKADGNYVLTITGKGNFNGTKTAEWNIKPTEPTENADKKTTARVRRGRTLAEATVTNGELFGIDGTTTLEGTFAWVDDTKVMNANGTEQMTFTPNNKNYVPITIDVAVSTYSSGGGSSSSSSASSYTVKFDTNGGSRISDVKVSKNETISEPTEPKKDGFEFAGWFTDKELKNKYDFDTKVTKNFTLYAAWTEAKTEPNPNPTDKPENPGSTKPDQTNPEKENPFDDVSKDDWYYDDVKSAVEKGLFNGTGSKIFAPNDSITRGMFVTVLYRAEGEPKVNTAIPFVDVSADSYFANAVIWAEQNGIVTGISETEFAPNDNITREQIAAIMFRYAKYKGAAPTGAWAIRLDYADLESVSDYAAEAVMYCTLKGIMQGKDNNLFAPQDSATRAEIAAILNRFLKANK